MTQEEQDRVVAEATAECERIVAEATANRDRIEALAEAEYKRAIGEDYEPWPEVPDDAGRAKAHRR